MIFIQFNDEICANENMNPNVVLYFILENSFYLWIEYTKNETKRHFVLIFYDNKNVYTVGSSARLKTWKKKYSNEEDRKYKRVNLFAQEIFWFSYFISIILINVICFSFSLNVTQLHAYGIDILSLPSERKYNNNNEKINIKLETRWREWKM